MVFWFLSSQSTLITIAEQLLMYETCSRTPLLWDLALKPQQFKFAMLTPLHSFFLLSFRWHAPSRWNPPTVRAVEVVVFFSSSFIHVLFSSVLSRLILSFSSLWSHPFHCSQCYISSANIPFLSFPSILLHLQSKWETFDHYRQTFPNCTMKRLLKALCDIRNRTFDQFLVFLAAFQLLADCDTISISVYNLKSFYLMQLFCLFLIQIRWCCGLISPLCLCLGLVVIE